VSQLPLGACCETQVGGIPIKYFEYNPDADGLPVLYLHGYSGTGFESHFFQGDLGSDIRLIAPDLPGLGLSGKPEIDYNLSFYLNFVRGFVEALDLDRFVLVGHSLGGKIAAVYAALDGPGRVEKLILLAPYGLDGEAGDIIEALSNSGSLVDVSFNLHNQTLLDVAVRLDVFHNPELIPKDLVDYIAAATFESDEGIRALANITRNAIARDPIDWLLPEISMSTLVIWGKEDRVLNIRHAATFVELIPDARLVEIDDCGHMPHVERADVTAAYMREFIQESAGQIPD